MDNYDLIYAFVSFYIGSVLIVPRKASFIRPSILSKSSTPTGKTRVQSFLCVLYF